MTEHGDDNSLPTTQPPGWPVELRGVTEAVVTTLGPNDLWNVAALGLHALDTTVADTAVADAEVADAAVADAEVADTAVADDAVADAPRATVTARTYGRTRTRRNFERRGGGVVQFTTDPREFVDAALTVHEEPEPVLPGADAWVEVDAERIGSEQSDDTEIITWALTPVDNEVLEERVPTINRGFGAVIDATVAASRLDVPDYDEAELLSRLEYFGETVERCGGPREREAFAMIDEHTGWRSRSP